MAYCIEADIENSIEYEELVLLSNDRDVNAISTLSLAVDSTSDIELTSSDEFPSTGRIKIDDEEIDYTENSENVLSGLTRAVNNTVEADHEIGSTVTEIHTVNSTVLTRAISDADALIDSYIGLIFNDLPFSDVPNVIRYTSVCLAIYNLYSRRISVPGQIEERYKQALDFLQRVLEGKITLDSSTDVSSNMLDIISINTYEDDKDFSISTTLSTSGSLDEFLV